MSLLLAILLGAAPAEPDYGHHGHMENMTCPVGGEHFRALVTDTYSTMGSRPDGRPDTYWFMPMPLPECPSNGLVIFATYTPAEVETLTRLVASDDYRALRSESTYYRAQWLAARIGRGETRSLQLLLVATWQVKPARGQIGQPLPSPERARRYQEEFVARVRALPPAPADYAYLTLYLRAANAERELGRFDSAAELLRQAAAMPATSGSADARDFVAKLATVVARHDESSQPLDMVPIDRVGWLCVDEALPDTPFNREYCARPDVRPQVEEARRVIERSRQRPAR